MKSSLHDASILNLLVELLKDGKAEIVPELASLEPIDKSLIVSALSEKTGAHPGDDFESWYQWFLVEHLEGDPERAILTKLKEMVERNKYYVDLFAQKKNK